MFCTKCGKDNGDNNKFCIECGEPLKAPNIVSEQPQEETILEVKDEQVEFSPVGQKEGASDAGTTILGDDTKVILTRQDGEEYRLSTFPVCLGKGSAADVILAGDESVSRQHICIHEDDENVFVIEDMNSSNKTYLNGNVLEPEELVILNTGDKIKLGNTELDVVIN